MTDWQRPKPAPELNKLEPLIGEWESIDKHYPMPWAPQGGKGQSKTNFFKALDGYCYLSDVSSETPFGIIKGHGIWFYDSAVNKYKIQWYDNFANHLQGKGDFINDDLLVFELRYCMGNTDIVERHTIKNIAKDSYDFIIETLLDGAFKLTSESKYKRMNLWPLHPTTG